MFLEDLLSALISSGYEPCPTEPTSPENDVPSTAYAELFHSFENASPLSSTSSSYSGDSLQSQSPSPPNILPTDVAFALPDASSCGDLDLSSTGPFFDGINTEIHATNTLMARPCSYTPVQSQSSIPPNFEPTDVAFTSADASKSFDAPDFLSTDACFDGINEETDATNTYRNHTVDNFGLLDARQVETDTTADVWDNSIDYGAVGQEYDGMGFSSIAGMISPEVNTRGSEQDSTFDEDFPLSSVRGDEFGYHSQGNGAYGLDMSLPSCSTHTCGDLQELIGPCGMGTRNVHLEPLRMVPPPPSEVCIPTQDSEPTQESNYFLRNSHHSLGNDILATPPNAISFHGSASAQMDVGLLISGPSTESSASSSSLPVQESSHAHPHAVQSTSVFMPFSDTYTAASSLKTLNQVFNQDQAPGAITDAKFNTFGRIGRSTGSKSESKKAKRKPYHKKTSGPKKGSRDMQPPPSESHRFADGRHKYEQLTDLEIRNLLEIYNVAEEQVSSVFYGLRRQHTPDTLYTCPMDKARLTLAQFKVHCIEHHSTVFCDPACPNRGNNVSKNHTDLCRWAVTCHAHASYPSVHSASVAMRHFENMHLRPHGLQCAHCESVHDGVRTLFRHMADGRGCINMRKWRRRQ